MAPKDKRERLVGCVLTRDDDFRAALIEDPEAAVRGLGIQLTDMEIAFIKGYDLHQLNDLADQVRRALGLGGGLGRWEDPGATI
jgi:hypothetical protein